MRHFTRERVKTQVLSNLRVLKLFGFPKSLSYGQILLLVLFIALFGINVYYWGFVHIYYVYNHHVPKWQASVGLEAWARAFGIYSLLCLMFMLFFNIRTTLWIDCFGIGFEHLIGLHRIFGI